MARSQSRDTTTLFSYVVDHDRGLAPNPENGFCTLVHCKYQGNSKKRNIVELAKVGDWVLGTGGSSTESAGPGNIIYLMRVDETPTFKEFRADFRFVDRRDRKSPDEPARKALVSKHFYYFGRNAISKMELPKTLQKDLIKIGPGFRSKYPPEKLGKLLEWFKENKKRGKHGQPCSLQQEEMHGEKVKSSSCNRIKKSDRSECRSSQSKRCKS